MPSERTVAISVEDDATGAPTNVNGATENTTSTTENTFGAPEGHDDLANPTPSPSPVGFEWLEKAPGKEKLLEISKLSYDEWQRRIGMCMKEKGFEFDAPKFVEDDRAGFYRALNPLNEAVARQFGYHIPNRGEEKVTQNTRINKPGYMAALEGPDDDSSPGCGALSFEAVYGVLNLNEIGNQYDALAFSLADRLQAYRATSGALELKRQWSACMAGRGYEYSSPEEPFAEFNEINTITQEELSVRLADLECDRSVGLTMSRSKWESEEFKKWESDTAAQWAEFDPTLQEALDKLLALARQT